MSNTGQDGAPTGHADNAPLVGPSVKPRSASRMSTAREVPLESTPKASRKATKGKSSAYTTESKTSRPSSRASGTSSVEQGGGYSVKDAGGETGQIKDGDEALGDEGTYNREEEIGETYMEADTAMISASPEETVTRGIPKSAILSPISRRPQYQIQSVPTVLEPPAEIKRPASAPINPHRQTPVNKPVEIEQSRQGINSPSAEANARQKNRWQIGNIVTRDDTVPLIIRTPPGPSKGKQAIRNTSGRKEKKEESLPRRQLDPREQTRLDYKLIDAIGKDRERLAALLDYEESMGNGGRKARILFANTNPEVTVQAKEKGKEPTTPKNKSRVQATLGLPMSQLEGERKYTHTPAPNTVTAKNRGLPTGGYLHDRLTNPTKELVVADGNPSNSSESSSSSDSDDDFNNMSPHKLAKYIKKLKKKNKERKEKEKLRKLQLSGFKTKLPTAYNGSNDFDTFEQFVYEVETWQEDTGFEDYEAVRHVKSFLKDKAASYYMLHVAPDVTQYTLTLVFQGLFDYCFPPDSQARIRRKFNNMTQSDRGFRDFYRELCKIQRRLADINDKSIAVRMWEGAHSYIRIEWAKNGYSAEHNLPEELEESAIRFETAKKIRRTEENRTNDRRDRSTYKGKRPDYRKPREGKRNGNTPRQDKPHVSTDKSPRKEKVPRLLPEKFAEYRAAGKCTFCHEIGHIAKDCPKQNFAKPKGISTLAVSFARIHELETATRESKSIYAISLDPGDSNEIVCDTQTLSTYAIKKETLPSMEWNTSKPRDKERKVPRPIILEVLINGNPARALLNSGSHGDFVSTTLVDQLKLKKTQLAKPIGLQMAVLGSKSSINWCANALFQYQGIEEDRPFDVMNIENYDLILGTPFLYQFKVTFGLNPPNVLIGSNKAVPLQGGTVTKIASLAAELLEDEIEKVRAQLSDACKDLFKTAAETPLPPLRVINHRIPLIDDNKPLPWRSSKCPEKLRDQWEKKRNAYVQTGRWRFATGKNATPMLFLTKKSADGSVKLRTVLDKQALNDNTHKLASPLPDQADILWRVQKHKYRSLIDGKDAYKQIRVEPKDVPHTLFVTPNGTMVSEVMQQGNTNASATYQSLMNILLEKGRGKYWDVFLDNIVVYTNSIEEHISRMNELFEILRRKKLYLSNGKIQFLVRELNILGHVIDEKGIQMDPDKIDNVLKWKTPTTKEQVMAFLGAVGYLAPNCEGIRIPMGVLSNRSAGNKHWNWDHTAQRAFEEVKMIVQKHRDNHRVAIDYSEEAPPINLVTDASCTGASGVLSQGKELSKAHVIAFWLGKFNSTQQNYAVHELELLAIKESLDRFRHLLVGCKFNIYTDHRALEHFQTQKNLSPRQVRWLQVFNEFDYCIIYIPGETNVLADTLSQIYENERLGTVRATSEYVQDKDNVPDLEAFSAEVTGHVTGPITRPLLVAKEAIAAQMPILGNQAIETQGPMEINGVDLPNKETIEEPRRSSRNRKPVTKLVVLHSPTHKRAPPKWKSNKLKEAEDTSIKKKMRAAKKINPEKESKSHGTNNDKDSITKDENDQKLEIQEEKTAYKPKEGKKEVSEMDQTKLPAPNVFYDPTPNTLEELRGQYQEDRFYKLIIDNPTHFKKFELINDLIYIKENEGKALCIPDIEIEGKKLREQVIKDAHVQIGHGGAKRTNYALRGKAWWKNMVIDVQDYCASCHICATTKHQTQTKMGLLTPLDPAREPWECVQIDFVGPLPESENLNGKWDMLCVIIDQATSMARLVPTKQTYKARDMAEVIFDNIYKLHGIPRAIVSDWDKLFDSRFWRELCQLTRTELRMSSGYHPETDGLTERSHKTLFQIIRQAIEGKQNEWVKHIPSVEYAMNLARSEATGYSPFFLNYGRYPTGSRWDTDSLYPGVRKFLVRQREALAAAHDAIIDTRTRMIAQANKHRRPADITQGDLVYLSMKNLRLPKKISRKLARKYIGPVRVTKEIVKGTTYELELPNDLKDRGIHPVFHASLLRIHVPNDDNRFPARAGNPTVSLTDAPKEWAVRAILQHAGKGKETQYEVLWANQSRTWEDYCDIKHLVALDEYLELQGVDSVLNLPWTAEYGIEEQEFGNELKENDIKTTESKVQVNSIAFNNILDDIIHCRNMSRTNTSLVDCGVYRANLFRVSHGSLDTAGSEPPKYQEFRSMLHTIREQGSNTITPSNPAVEMLTTSMNKLAIALGQAKQVAQQKGVPANETTQRYPVRPRHQGRPIQRAYIQARPPINAPKGPKAHRNPLIDRIGARVSPYERHRTRGGARRREWREKWRNEKAKEQGKENRDTKGDGEEKQTNAYRKSTEETSGPSSGHGNNKVDGGVTGTVPNIPKRENYTCPIHANKTEEIINDEDWDWDQFANSEAD
ncbi:Pol polyprotein/retrotransposon [Rhizoctonia solani]|uniref:RNA-directed DNA polymerase n=1 Tax=Rhizoctonia solani TaxID=456999 RepID=A0A8H8P4H6_9AGAM|nr:Pol polyprotein/retrotransposon [Rhizoctonia solani]QRW23678.1 Pol polyprotein/retrotransposon [Rhizoctonia solani]